MKLNIVWSALTLLAVADAAGHGGGNQNSQDTKREECEDCLEDLDDARECLRTCNEVVFDPAGDGTGTLETTGSLLNDCLDPSRSDSVESLDELIECCDMSDDCEDELEDAQECVQFCFDDCIVTTSKDYLECINDENRGVESDRCSRQECLDGFLDSIEDDIVSNSKDNKSSDLLDFKNLEKRLKKIDEEDLEDCELLEDFIETVCDIGDDCCERCNEELATLVDCVINDIVIPFVAIELNTTIDICPIDEDCDYDRKARKARKARQVSPEEEDLFNRALALPKTSKRDAQREAFIKKMEENRVLEEVTTDEAVAACEKQMNMNTIAHNVTYAANVFITCVTAAAIESLPDEKDSGSAAYTMVTGLMMVGASIFALF